MLHYSASFLPVPISTPPSLLLALVGSCWLLLPLVTSCLCFFPFPGGASPKTFESVIKRACDTSEKEEVLVIVLQRVSSQGTWAGVTGGIGMLSPEQKKKTHLFMTNHTTGTGYR